MKQIMFILISIILMSGNCKKEGKDCHRSITIINKSIIYSTKLIDGANTSTCLLTKNSTLQNNEIYEERLNSCWESRLTNNNTFEFYIVDPIKFNMGGFYTCDSLEIKNKILKHYNLTLDDLKNMNWTVTYP